MSTQTNRVMIVDDNPSEIQTILGALKAHYTINIATSGEQAIKTLTAANEEQLPELLLLDINMPGIDGYETCLEIKKTAKLQHIEVVFFSANDSTEEITKGFDVGACDYVIKPFDSDILLSKIKTALKNKEQRKSLTAAAKTANTIAMSAMRDSGDLGIILSFLRACFDVNNLDELAHCVIDALVGLNLTGSTLLYDNADSAIHSSDNSISELEITLLQRLRSSAPSIHEYNRKVIIGREGIALLINDLPEDRDNAARLKDHLMTLVEGIQNKLAQIKQANEGKTARLLKVRETVVGAHKKLTAVQEQQKNHKAGNMSILDEMVHEVEASFFAMGLTDAQEEQLLHIFTTAASKALDHFEKGIIIDQQLETIINELSSSIIKFSD